MTRAEILRGMYGANGGRFIWTGKTGRCRTCIGYAGRRGDSFLCLEVKIRRDALVDLDRIEGDIHQLEREVGHRVTWQPHGKEGHGPPIVALYYRDRDDTAETEPDWWARIEQRFPSAVIRRYAL